MSRRLWAAPMLLCAAFALAACSDVAKFQTPIPTASPLKARTVAQTPAVEREHERILSAYGGSYDGPKPEGRIRKTAAPPGTAPTRPGPGHTGWTPHLGRVEAYAPPTRQRQSDPRPHAVGR